jgi:hypothetical protein
MSPDYTNTVLCQPVANGTRSIRLVAADDIVPRQRATAEASAPHQTSLRRTRQASAVSAPRVRVDGHCMGAPRSAGTCGTDRHLTVEGLLSP